MAATLGLVLIPAVGHALSEGLAWAPLVAGAGGVGAVALWGHRPIHRWYALGAVALGLWAAAAWWVGLADPIVDLGFMALIAGVAVVWIRYVHPRARVHVRGGSSWPWFGDRWGRWRFQQAERREIKAAMASWLVASYWGSVPRSEIRSAEADIDKDFRLLTVALVPGRIELDLDNRRAASAIGAPVANVVVVQSERGSDRPANVVLVQWYPDGIPAGEAETEPAGADSRLDLVAGALDAESRPGREIAERAELPYDDWLWREALPELEASGRAEKTAKGWRAPAGGKR